MTDARQPTVSVSAEVRPMVSLAAWHSSLPVVRRLRVRNTSDVALRNVTLKVTTTPDFARSRSWHLASLPPLETLEVGDCDLPVNLDFPNDLREPVVGKLQFRVDDENDQPLGELDVEVRVLPTTVWGGPEDGLELLPAFVRPQDAAISQLVRRAATELRSGDQPFAFDGYPFASDQQFRNTLQAIWNILAAENLSPVDAPTDSDPGYFSIHPPQEILRRGAASPLDAAVLSCSLLEAAGFHTAIILTAIPDENTLDSPEPTGTSHPQTDSRQVFAAVWRNSLHADRIVESDHIEYRKAVAAGDLLPFDASLLTRNPPADFTEAVHQAEPSCRVDAESCFLALINVERARIGRIRPLESPRSDSTVDSDASNPIAPEPFAERSPQPPGNFSEESEDLFPDESPSTPAGRIDRWQRKLLDLSLRNKLLNFRLTQQAVPFLCNEIAALEDKLASGTPIRLVSLPEQAGSGERDAEAHREKTGEDLNQTVADALFARNELGSPLSDNILRYRLTELYRRARNDLAEGGINTLYLAVGFLRWKRRPEDERSFLAPLLLLPVRLTRRSASSPFYLQHLEDEVRFNATLIQLLKRDFECDLSRYEASLPRDEAGVDIPAVLAQVRHDIRDVRGTEVIDQTALAAFSFSKYLMWRDLADRSDQLEQNRVVRHLVHNPDEPFDSAGNQPLPTPEAMDGRSAESLIHPLPADSSQLTAVAAAAAGHDFVLVGPPGTGKSQTITNIIAHCLASKRTVLFVAEKTAALDVVHRRLLSLGLGDCCLELHSNKAERKHVLQQLQAAWTAKKTIGPNPRTAPAEQADLKRERLNRFSEALHKPNGGWSVFEAAGHCINHPHTQCPEYSHPADGEAAYDHLQDAVASVAAAARSVNPAWPLQQIRQTEWSNRWEADLLAHGESVAVAADRVSGVLSNWSAAVCTTSVSDCSAQQLSDLNALAELVLKIRSPLFNVIADRNFRAIRDGLSPLLSQLDEFHGVRNQLSAPYADDSLLRIPIDELERMWRSAAAQFFPFAWWTRRKTRKLLQTYTNGNQPDPERDLPQLRTLAELGRKILSSPLSHVAQFTNHIHESLHDAERIQEPAAAVNLGDAVLSVLRRLNQPRADLVSSLTDGTALEEIRQPAATFQEHYQDFQEAAQSFCNLADALPYSNTGDHALTEVSDLHAVLQAHRTRLRPWTAWQSARQNAVSCGLEDFPAALEQSLLEPDDLADAFRLAWTRWWVPQEVDAVEPLRTFQGPLHEELIAEFHETTRHLQVASAKHVHRAVRHDLPAPAEVSRRSELGILRHQMQLKRPSKSIRELVETMPEAFQQLAPCVLMSPLSIAQYLPADYPPFDVVVFDEASQITTWDAVGAVARGRQTIIVGDPKQLPPTSFFSRADTDDDDDALEDYDRDLESILDEAVAAGLPTLQLNWHYRSRHESLIAFSNRHYYNSTLVTFPSPETNDRAVHLRYLPHAEYLRGTSRTNPTEARTIVDDAVQRMQEWLDLPEEGRPTLGVITFNRQQQSLIQDLLDEALQAAPELEWFFSDERIEPVAVKNLENVQGDERDVMMFSITFGADDRGRVPLTFGALNRDGGERRLNVAVTRARQELIVYSSITGEQIEAERSKARGIHDLRDFLIYARRGAIRDIPSDDSDAPHQLSDFVLAVADFLKTNGWSTRTDVGTGGFRIPLAVIDPNNPENYIAAIETDGPSVAATAADRHITRPAMLKTLGWNVISIWTLDWWYDRPSQEQQLLDQLNQLTENQLPASPH